MFASCVMLRAGFAVEVESVLDAVLRELEAVDVCGTSVGLAAMNIKPIPATERAAMRWIMIYRVYLNLISNYLSTIYKLI